MGKPWLPFPRAKLIQMGRCPDCGCHPKTGCKSDCPSREDPA